MADLFFKDYLSIENMHWALAVPITYNNLEDFAVLVITIIIMLRVVQPSSLKNFSLRFIDTCGRDLQERKEFAYKDKTFWKLFF